MDFNGAPLPCESNCSNRLFLFENSGQRFSQLPKASNANGSAPLLMARANAEEGETPHKNSSGQRGSSLEPNDIAFRKICKAPPVKKML